jgi:glutaminyl-peptide cyclotransferase
MQRLVPQWIQFADSVEGGLIQAIELRNVLDEQQTTSVAAYHKTMRALQGVLFLVITALTVGAQNSPTTPVYGFRIVHVYPHDSEAFTQGLEYRGGFLYEGTGLNGRSTIRKVELESGRVVQETKLDEEYFGEGITVLGDRLLELTWRSRRGFEYDRNTFRVKSSFDYPGEGWGLTNDGSHIFMSDGSAEIRVWAPGSLREFRRIAVHDGNQAVSALNELEYVRGEIYANIWETDRIARISPADGHVSGWIDLTGLLPRADLEAGADVLNGIAYDSLGDRLFVTGKLWPKLFEIQLVLKSQPQNQR